MTAELRDFQQEVLDKLRQVPVQGAGLVVSSPGTGVRRAMEEFVHEAATHSRVVILARPRVLLEQWARRLEARGDNSVRVLDTAEAALQVAEGAQNGSGVLLATYRGVSRGPIRRVLSELEIDVIIHDGPMSVPPPEIQMLNKTADRVIALILGEPSAYWSTIPIIARLTAQEVAPEQTRGMEDAYFDLSPQERTFKAESLELLEQYAASQELTLESVGDSRPILHSLLLRLASGSEGEFDSTEADIGSSEESSSQHAWRLLDRLESMDQIDSRLVALDDVLSQHLAAGRTCVIVAMTTREVDYIAAHLEQSEKFSEAVVPDATNADSTRSVAPIQVGRVMLGTPILLAAITKAPAHPTVIWWSEQQTDGLPSALVHDSDLQVVRLRERGEHS